MPFLLAEILNFQGTVHLIGVGSLSKVLILHLPAEKEKGMLRLYSNYIRKGRMPSEQKVWKICRLKHRTFLDYIGYAGITFLKKLRKK